METNELTDAAFILQKINSSEAALALTAQERLLLQKMVNNSKFMAAAWKQFENLFEPETHY